MKLLFESSVLGVIDYNSGFLWNLFGVQFRDKSLTHFAF